MLVHLMTVIEFDLKHAFKFAVQTHNIFLTLIIYTYARFDFVVMHTFQDMSDEIT